MSELNSYITNSVGDSKKGAANRDNDVKTVRGLLNANVHIIKNNRSDRLLPITDRLDNDMLRAIIEFQRRQGAAQTGVIQPRDDAFRALSEFNGPRGMRASYRLIDWLKKPPIEDFRSYPYDDASRPPNATIG